MMKPRLYLALVSTLLALFTWNGCSTTPIDENDPAALLKEAEAEVQSDHYAVAIDKLRNIKNKFPYSKYAIDAQLRLADIYFLQESFAEAASAYETFRDLHPKHEKAEYATFRAGKSYFKDIPSTLNRDLTSAHKALEAYGDFLRQYPDSQYALEAQKDVVETRNLVAQKELSIGEFYFKRDFYDSAQPRFKKVIELYPETDAAKTAQDKLNQIELKTKKDGSSNHGNTSGSS